MMAPGRSGLISVTVGLGVMMLLAACSESVGLDDRL